MDIQSLAEVDAIVYTKDPNTAVYAKSAHARKLQIRDFTFSYSVDGESTEDYTAVGSEKRLLQYDVVVDKFVTGTTTFTLSQTPIQLKNGNYGLTVTVDGVYMTEVTGAPATGQYRISAGTLTTGDARVAQVIAVYHSNASSAWTDVGDATLPVAIRGRDAYLYLSANGIQRVQGVTINGTLNVTPVREMGSRVIIGYNKQVPNVEGSITVLDTDNELINLFQSGTTTTSGVYEWTPGEGCTASGISLSIKLVDPCDTTVPYTVEKTVYLDSVEIVGDSLTVNVNQDAQQVFNWRSTTGHCVVFEGDYP